MSTRAREVFRVVVESYLSSGAPVGSRTISKLAGLNLSPASIRNAFPHAVDPDGRVNLDAMRRELAFFKEKGLVQSQTIKVEDLVDMRFVEAAVKELGPYKRAP